MISSKEQFEKLEALIVRVDALIISKELTNAQKDKAQAILDALAEKYQHNENVGSKRYMLYELQALLKIADGDAERAQDFIQEAQELMTDEDEFISRTVRKATVGKKESKAAASKHGFSGKLEGWLALYGVGIILSPFVIIYDLFTSMSGIDSSSSVGSYMFMATFIDVLSLIGLAIIGYHFFAKKTAALTSIPIYEGAQAVVYLFMLIWLYGIYAEYGVNDSSGPSTLGRTVMFSVVWLVYWLVSKRAKATFVRA